MAGWFVFWHWWALAAVLLVFEMMLPGVVFLFLAVGATASGLFLLVVPALSIELQLVVFAVVSVASAVGLRPTLKRLQMRRKDDPNLNARGDSLVGRVKLGDGSWTVTGPDMAAGARVRVVGVDGTELRVEPAP